MTDYDVSDLVKEVKVILDRNQESAEMIADDTDTLTQDEIIRGVLPDAARAIEAIAPASKLGDVSTSTESTSWTKDGAAYIGQMSLPDDLLRLVRVKASDWKRSGEIIADTDEKYRYQQNPYVRGNPQRPIAVLVHNGGTAMLELYTSGTDNATVDLSYVASPTEKNGKIGLPDALKDAIVYMAAYLTCVSLGDTQTAAGYRTTAYELAGIVESTQA